MHHTRSVDLPSSGSVAISSGTELLKSFPDRLSFSAGREGAFVSLLWSLNRAIKGTAYSLRLVMFENTSPFSGPKKRV